MKTLELTLCYNCVSIYNDMPDRTVKRKDYKQTIKDNCDICRTHKGFDFVIKERKNYGRTKK